MYEHSDNFGERMSDITQPELWVWSASSGSVKFEASQPIHPAKPVWVDGWTIVFAGYDRVEPHLGIMY
jgi:hypothetical protein